MSIRGDLRIGEVLQGTLREKSQSYTVMGRIVLKQGRQGNRRSTRWEQWRLINDDGKELWIEIDRDANEVILHESVPIQPTIDPLALDVGQTLKLKVRGRPYTVEVKGAYRADIDHETGSIRHLKGANAATTCVELHVKGARKSLSSIVIDEHRSREHEAYSRAALSPSQQSKVFGRTVSRPWWVPGFVRRFWRWFPAAISGESGSWLTPLFWFVLLFGVMVIIEWIDDDGLIPSEGGSFYRNRSVYGGGGGGVGK